MHALPNSQDIPDQQTTLRVYTDGASRGNPGKAAAAFVVYTNDDQLLHEHAEYIGTTTNNTAEYTAFRNAVTWLTTDYHITLHSNVNFFADSELMVRQLTGIYKIKEPHIKELADQIKQKLSQLSNWTLTHIPRAQNKRADHLCNEILDTHKNAT